MTTPAPAPMPRGSGHTTRLAGDALAERTGESARHQILFERVASRIYRYFQKMVRNPEDAEECAQETLLLLERSLRDRRYDAERSFNTWMWIKAHTVWAQWCRRREKRAAEVALAPEHVEGAFDSGQGPAEAEERLDKAVVLEQVRAELGEEAFEAFVLYYQGGLNHAEVGELLGRHRTTIAERIAAAHRVIDRLLGASA